MSWPTTSSSLSCSKIISIPELSAHDAETVLNICSPRTPYLDYPCSMRELLRQLYWEDLAIDTRSAQNFVSFAKTMTEDIIEHCQLGEDYIVSEGLFYWKIRSVIKLLEYLTTYHHIGQRMLSLLRKIDICIEYRVTDVHAADILSRSRVPDHYLQLTRRLFLMEFLLIWKSDLDDLGRTPSQPIYIK